MTIEAIRNHIVFEFLDRVNNDGTFEELATDTGIALLSSADSSAKQARWGRIVSLGPEVDDELRAPDCEILVTNLMWSKGVLFNGRMVWRTDDTQVCAYRVPDGSPIVTFES